MPVLGVGRHGYLSDIQALCWLYFCMGCLFSCGIGQIFSLCGNIGFNFAACYSCNGRAKIRRKFHLPPTFCLPPLIDDCLVHFLCFYCASHQELRELAVRGRDGPGMHILDVLPDAFNGVEGIDKVVETRRAQVASMLAKPPILFMTRDKKKKKVNPIEVEYPLTVGGGEEIQQLETESTLPDASEYSEQLGWTVRCCLAPEEQLMDRMASLRRIHSAEEIRSGKVGFYVQRDVEESVEQQLGMAPRAWSVAY